MGSGTSQIIDPVRVPKTKGKCPPPLAPKWFLPDIRPLVCAPDADDPESRSIDWNALERSLDAEEDGIDTNTDVIRTKPSSGIGGSSTDSGTTRNRQVKKRGQKHLLSFDAIDKRANAVLPLQSASFEKLLTFLKQPIDQGQYPDTCLVRALTVWFSKQDNKKTKYKHADVSTPLGIIQHLKHQTLTYTEAYTLLCRGAGIPTVMVPGVVRCGRYEPGDIIDNGARDTWCALHVDGSWQLVHPKWVCRGTYGKEKEGLIQIEDDSFLAENFARKQREKGIVRFNEEFFMPKPEVFIFRCYADDKRWHLVPEEKMLKSLEEFTMLAYISPPFFKFGLTLASNPYCVQRAINGTVIIEIVAPKEYVHALNLGYQIESDGNEKQNTNLSKNLLEKSVLSRLVINYRCNDRFVFEIRLPVQGAYRFVITGGFGTGLCNLCRFKLISTESIDEWFVAPVHPGSDGWGPGPKAENAGLLLPTKPSGLLVVQSRQHSGVNRNSSVFYHLATLNFQINKALIRKFEYTVEVVPSVFIEKRNFESEFMPNGELRVDVQMKQRKSKPDQQTPHDFPVRAQFSKDVSSRQFTVHVIGNLKGEECAVLIKATEMDIMNNIRVPKKDSLKVVCHYMITNASTFFFREPTDVKLCKMELQDAMQTSNISRMQKAMDKCLKFRVPVTDDSIASAESRLEYLTLRTVMLDCVKRRNFAILNDTLGRVAGYRYREALVVEVEKLLEFRKELKGLQGYTQALPTLRDANEELYNLSAPTPPVHNTMKVLCLLLGYDGDLKNWKYIHKHLKVAPVVLSEMVILKRMAYMSERSFPWHNMDVGLLTKAYRLLHEYPFEQVKHVSLAAATMYKWIDGMLSRAKQVLQNQ